MSNASRKQRGNETQNAVADYMAKNGWPHATSAGAGRNGEDVLGVPGLAVEVKARRRLDLIAWLKQARKTPGVPMVVHRPDGMGPASVADWPMTLRLEDGIRLLREAGFGDPIPPPTPPPDEDQLDILDAIPDTPV